MEDVTNVIRFSPTPELKMSPDGDFFQLWVEFLKPIHKLTDKEMEVLALYLKYRYKLTKKISDPDIVEERLMSMETRKIIREQCGIKNRHLNVILSKFRKNGVLVKNKENERFYQRLIPSMSKNGAGLMILFDFKKNEQHIKLGNRAGIQKS